MNDASKSLTLMDVSSKQVAVFAKQSLMSFWENLERNSDEDQWSDAYRLMKPMTLTALNRALFFSLFLQRTLLAQPQCLNQLLRLPLMDKPLPLDFFTDTLSACNADQEEVFAKQLRNTRALMMSRFIIQHFNATVPLQQLTTELSLFADACIQRACAWHYDDLMKRFGCPVGGLTQQRQEMVVLGMGKLGAFELNLSSDIDLIFAYPEAGMTNGSESITNQEFFSQLGKRLIYTLNRKTAEGFVFRVDMRLRPYGQSGLLVYSFQALENYYQDQGREWERYAMIKARAIGSPYQGKTLERLFSPFVYRKYTDFTALDGIRDMKTLIVKEVRRLGKSDDIKLGAGGIREVEFIAQAHQLIYGGKKSELQIRDLEGVLNQLQQLNLLADDAVSELLLAYRFLRNVEHCLQAFNDEQTHKLPQTETDQKKLALAMHFDSWNAFSQVLNKHQLAIRKYFDGLIEKDFECLPKGLPLPFDLEKNDYSGMTHWMKLHAFTDEKIEAVSSFIRQEKIQRLSVIEWSRLTRCLQLILPVLSDNKGCDKTVGLMLSLLESVVQRSSYLVLLYENPQVIERLLSIAAASSWVMHQFIQYPALLDELLEEKSCDELSSLKGITNNLQQQALRVPQDDLEEQMDMLRYFKMANVSTISLAEIHGDISLFSVSGDLTHLAESILAYVLDMAWYHLTQKFGYPTKNDKPFEKPPFAIVAYGKLGGSELSYQSDLDLVFMYDAPMHSMTDGDNPIDNVAFFTRLGQRIIHMLSTRTKMGQLYEIDMRLRPSGNKGLLVTSLGAFSHYQAQNAWTWEQQALVRARVVAGSASIASRFQALRESILQMPRDSAVLAEEVVAMRQKMFDHLTPAHTKDEAAEVFDLKHSRWGIIDLEFMVQYAVLAFAHKFTQLTDYTDNIRLLEVMADCHLITDQERSDLVNAYQAYRSFGHLLALKQEKNEAKTDTFSEHRFIVKTVWQKLIDPHLCGGDQDKC